MTRRTMRMLEVFVLFYAAVIFLGMWLGCAAPCAPYVMTALLSFGVTTHALLSGEVA